MWIGSSRKVERFKARLERRDEELQHKELVRKRDLRRCRFPLCGCRKFGFSVHVSHQQHKGMGGNPKGDRSTTDKMLVLCAARHRLHRFALDRGTIKWVGLTRHGADGPVKWLVDMPTLVDEQHGRSRWVEVARERRVQELEPLTDEQREILENLARMEQ